MINIYPKLKYMKIIGESIARDKELPISRKKLNDFIEKSMGIEIKEYNPESYGIIINNEKVEIYCDNDRAFNFALLTLKRLKNEDKLYNSIIFDYPHMKIRGIVEGFYGEPWTFKERWDAVNTISDFKMNTYIYAPKNDLHHRIKWSEPYEKNEINKIKELVNHCKNKYVDFYYTLGPGVSMKYSSKEHLKLLINKYLQLYEIGVRNFGILFDDIPLELTDNEDRKVFQTLDRAHSYIVNILYEYFKSMDKDCRFIVCGSLYNGRGSEEYIANLGKNISSEIELFWTGRSICSQELDSKDAKYFFENTMHKPLYWDNYPVNDADMSNEMHLGPLIGRDIDLYNNAAGLVCNVMEYKEASMIPIITAADYLWNSIDYNKEESLKRGINEVVGVRNTKDFNKFNKFCLKSCLDQKGNEEFFQKLIKFEYLQNEGRNEEAFNELLLYFQENLRAAKLLKSSMENKALLEDILKWLKKFIAFNKLWIRCIGCGKEYTCGSKLKAFFMAIPIPLQYWLFSLNPISMMNFETKVLMDSISIVVFSQKPSK